MAPEKFVSRLPSPTASFDSPFGILFSTTAPPTASRLVENTLRFCQVKICLPASCSPRGFLSPRLDHDRTTHDPHTCNAQQMASSYSTSHFEDPSDDPLPHPYLREPKLFVSGLAPNARKEDLAEILRYCIPFRPNIPVDEQGRALPGIIASFLS